MKESYKKIIELEDYYKDMKKKHPNLNIWDKLLKIIDKRKREILKYDY